jgi:hypothetical protein
MILFSLGLVVGTFLAVFLLAMVVKSKYLDYKAIESLEENQNIRKKYLPVIFRNLS